MTSSGILRAGLQRAVSRFFFAATMVSVACDDTGFASVPGGAVDLVDFSRSDSIADADGDATVRLTARVPRESQRAPTLVTFTTDAGSFVSNQKQEIVAPIDTSGTAAVHLRAPTDPALATVRAFAGQTTLAKSVRFIRTYPDTVLVDAATLSVLNNATFPISARLRRTSGGAPTKGAEVRFTATDSAGRDIGLFGVPTLSDAAGVASVHFCPCRVPAYEGRLAVRATTKKDSIASVSGVVTLLVSKQ